MEPESRVPSEEVTASRSGDGSDGA
jgi:hypothetical protein